jgi:hypothetical protein
MVVDEGDGMSTTDFHLALLRVQHDYLEMPGLRLTALQGSRLWTLPVDLCRVTLDALVTTGFLVKTDRECYGRRGTKPVSVHEIDPMTWVIQTSAA